LSAMMGFILAMTRFPEVQKCAQEEIDRVVGGDHLPNVSDRERLPYCAAMCKELLRWHIVTPLGVPHSNREADICGGYYIPPKTTIYTNQWAMHMDPEEYPDPEVFRPERFLSAPGKRLQRDPHKVTFGFGRRVCPGQQLAENTVGSLPFITRSKSLVEPCLRYSSWQRTSFLSSTSRRLYAMTGPPLSPSSRLLTKVLYAT